MEAFHGDKFAHKKYQNRVAPAKKQHKREVQKANKKSPVHRMNSKKKELCARNKPLPPHIQRNLMLLPFGGSIRGRQILARGGVHAN
jgi:hypothetical protein